jgi:hypothetical protein
MDAMTKKRLLLIALFPLAIVVTLGVLVMLPPRPGVTKANFDQIGVGMTRAEVEAIFGREGSGPLGETAFYWNQDDWSLARIDFLDNCVTDKAWGGSHLTGLNRVRRWLRLQ